MTESFFERPILNSPYEVPKLHHALDQDGQPTDEPPVFGRRRSELITPVPKPRKTKNKPEQGKLALGDCMSSEHFGRLAWQFREYLAHLV
jgi:type III restriction enzyme